MSRFNGYEFRNYYGHEELNSSIITTLSVDSKGILWIGTSNGISRFDGMKFTNFEPDSKRYLDIQSMYVNSRDEVYYISSRGWGTIKDDKIIELPSNFGTSQLSFIDGDEQGRFYIADRKNILIIVNGDKFEKIEIGDPLLHITALKWDRFNERLWIGSDRGIYYYEGGKVASIANPFSASQHNVTSIIIPDEKNFLIGIYGVGIYKVEDDKLLPFFTGQGLLINCLYLDELSNVWLGYDGRGLGKLSASPFENIPTASGIIRGFVMSLFQDNTGEIWCGTIASGIYKFKNRDDRSPVNIRLGNTTAINSIRSVIKDHKGIFWFGTMAGVVSWDGKTNQVYTTNDGLTHQVVRNIFQDNRKDLWISTDDRITIYSNRKFSAFKYNSQLSHPMVRQVIQDKEGKYWIATLGGLYIYDGENLALYNKSENLSQTAIETLMIDSKNNLWIGGVDSLFVIWSDGTIKRFGVEEGFESGSIYFLLEAGDGTIWVGTGNGIQYYFEGRFYLYNQESGLVGNECNARACMKDHDGNLWFAMLEGISIYSYGKGYSQISTPPVYFDEFVIDGVRADLNSKINVSPNIRNFTFKYHSVNLNPAIRVKYRVRLHPMEMEWSKPTSERIKTYSYLKPGNYSFQVTTFLDSQVDTQSIAAIGFTIVPPIWNQWWFILIISLSAAGMIAVMISLRIRRLQREKALLSEAVRAHTQELQEKNRELESFAYTVSHDLKDPIGVIVGYAQVLEDYLKKQNVQGTKQFTEGIKRNSDRILHFIDDMLQLSRSGRVIEKSVPTDTKIIVSQIANDIKQKRKLKTNFITVGNLPVVMADADRLYMVFYNLINNAYKYRDRKRTLKVNISYSLKGDYHQFTIKDNGIGIKDEDFKKIFQPGVRLKVVDTSGTGFGLRIVKKIVEAHGGKIWVESKLGSGSAFYFTIKAMPLKERE